MTALTIVGLGPGDPGHLTRETWDVLAQAAEVWLRTRRHPTVAGLPQGPDYHDFDALYEQNRSFDHVYEALVEQVLALAQRPQGVTYAVPGHPMVGEATVTRLLERAAPAGLTVRVVEGLSFVEPALSALRVDAMAGLQIHDALEIANRDHPPLNPDLPALIGQLYGRPVASHLKLALMNQYPDEHPVTLVQAAGTAQAQVVTLPLWELDRREDLAHLSTLYVPPLAGVSSFEGLQDTVAHLRAPEGCPWDREQTHESLRAGILEEAYEAVTAIDAGDMEALREELGDLLLQVLLQTQIATEEGDFQMADVIAGIDAKLKHRHPHVWGDLQVGGTTQVLANWEALKREEREKKDERRSALDGVPLALPALSQALSFWERAVRLDLGLKPEVEPEGAQLGQACRDLAGQGDTSTPEDLERRLGELLFALVAWASQRKLDPEDALRRANARFAARFRAAEVATR